MSLKGEEIESLANSAPGMIQKLILKFKKVVEKGQLASPSLASKTSKGNTSYSFGVDLDNKPKRYHKMPFNEM